MSKKLIVHGSVLGEIGKRFEQKSDISPLHIQDKYSEIAESELNKAKDNQLEDLLQDKEISEMIMKLASPSFFGRFRYSEGVSIKETTVFYDNESHLICGITTGLDEMVTLDPSIDIGDEIDQVTQLIGHSVIQYSEFAEEMSIIEGLVLAGMIDLYRKNMYSKIGVNETFDPNVVGSIDVYNEIFNTESQWIMWLTYIVKQSIALEITCEQSDVAAALESLSERNLLEKLGLGFKITQTVESLAVRMHKTDNIIVANCGFASDTKVHVMSFISAQFGLKDILMMDTATETLSMTSVSASQVLKLLMDFMYSPMAFFTDDVEADQKEAQDIKVDELIVEKEIKESDEEIVEEVEAKKFCIHCGQKVNVSAMFCPHCGGKL